MSWGSRLTTVELCQNRCSGAPRCIGIVFRPGDGRCGLLQQCDTGLTLQPDHDSYLRTSFDSFIVKETLPGKQCSDVALGDSPTRLSGALPPTPKDCFEYCRPFGATHFSLDQSLFCKCHNGCSQVDNDFSVLYSLRDQDVILPTAEPTTSPTVTGETLSPSNAPTKRPTDAPFPQTLQTPTASPNVPTDQPTGSPTLKPTPQPTSQPTSPPTEEDKTIIWNLTLVELIGIISAIIALIGIVIAIWSSSSGPIFVRKPEGSVRLPNGDGFYA